MRRTSRAVCIAAALSLGVVASSCVRAARTYPLVPRVADRTLAEAQGSLSVERIEGGQQLVVLQLAGLPPPERLGPGVREYVVWLAGPEGKHVNVGTLRYDRAHRSGNLLATTELSAFTVRVTGERNGRAAQPSGVLLAERRVTN
jgi:hypothetical protein